jgi:hypothetical protein
MFTRQVMIQVKKFADAVETQRAKARLANSADTQNKLS